jgi:TonB family protein
MNNVSKLAVIVSLGALFSPLALTAKTVEQAYVDSYQSSPAEVPVPLSVVTPHAKVSTEEQVELTFIVNAQGKPTDIAVKSATNPALAGVTKDALAKWTFAPAKRNGEPVARKVVLPVRFVVAD